MHRNSVAQPGSLEPTAQHSYTDEYPLGYTLAETYLDFLNLRLNYKKTNQ